MEFRLQSPFQPAGDQPQAIAALTEGLREGRRHQVLMGVTGSGKTFTMANVHPGTSSARRSCCRTTRRWRPSSTANSRSFFPHNAVHYFVSYYDYYQPEAYIPQRDIYIEKDASINQEIDRLRLAADQRPGQPARRDHRGQRVLHLWLGLARGLSGDDDRPAARASRSTATKCCASWSTCNTSGTTSSFTRGKFRVRGDCVELWPSYEEYALRIEFWGDEIEQLSIINPTSGEVIRPEEELFIYPAKHFVMPEERIAAADRRDQARSWKSGSSSCSDQGKLLEAQRLNARTRFDIEMMLEVGYCPGIENYSRPLERAGRRARRPTRCSIFFPRISCCSSTSRTPRCRRCAACIAGDYSRKVDARRARLPLPSALDNRPLKFDEWEQKIKQVVFVSATPGPYELEQTGGEVVEQVIRPTGLLGSGDRDQPARGQVPHLLGADSRARRRRRAGAGDHAHQAPGRGPVVLPRRAGRDAANGCTASSTPSSASSCSASCARDDSTRWSASTCCAKGSTCPKSRSWPFSTPTRKAFCAAKRR